MKPILVGIDGSDRSLRALEWALEEASLRGARVDVVHVYEPPKPTFAGAMAAYPPMKSVDEPHRTDQELYESARRRASDRLTELVGQARDKLGVTVETRSSVIPDAHPAEVLIDRSKGASLLVLANRGLSPVRGMLLGSVSLHCSQHSRCPVVIVPEAEEGAD